MHLLTLGLVGAIMCLWFTFDAGTSICIMLTMLLLVSYVANHVLLESSPAQYRDPEEDEHVFDTDEEEVELKPKRKVSQDTERKPWHVPALRIREMVMPSSKDPNGTMQVGQSVWANSEEPIAIENEYFSGRVLFLLKTEPRSPTWGQLFVGRRRLFWIQLQGKFKKQPKGTVFVGGEIPDKMKLGFFTKSLCRVLLSVINCLVVGLHNSFGRLFPKDVTNIDDEELPHLAFPLHSSVDEFICTPAGDVPPVLGSDSFMETREERSKRRSGKHPYAFNTQDTYSFSFFNFYIDFENWKVVNAPGVPDINLSQFWGNMPMRIVSYSLADPTNGQRHSRRQKLYNFCFEITPPHVLEYDDTDQTDTLNDPEIEELDFLRDELRAHTQLANDLHCFVFTIPCWLEYFSTHDHNKGAGQRRVAYVFDILEFTDTSRTHLKRHHIAIHSASQTHMPLTLANDHPTQENFSKQFDFIVESKGDNVLQIETERIAMEKRLIHISRQKVMMDTSALKENASTTSMAHLIAAKNQLKRLLTSPSTVLPYAPFFSSRSQINNASQCQVLRMVWGSHWRNEWMILGTGKTKQLRFFRMSSSTACVTIDLADILSISANVNETLNLPLTGNCNGMHWFQIETLSRVHVVAVASYQEYEFWTQLLADEIEKMVMDSSKAIVLSADVLSKPFKSIGSILGKNRFSKETFHAVRDDGRLILNDRRISKRFGLPEEVDICDIAEKALRMAVVLQQHPTMCLTSEVLIFLDLVSKLKQVTSTAGASIAQLNIADRTAFFLNLYHCIVLHGSFLELLPVTKTKLNWCSFYNVLSYDVAGYSFCPAEIEHCIIRAALSPIKSLFPTFIVPHFADDDPRQLFKIPSSDYRLDFALNCLTKSCVQVITIYRGIELEQQLNYMARVVLSSLMSTDTKRHVIYLPRICEWYHQDFPGCDHVMTMVSTLSNHLDGSIKRTVETLLSTPSKLSIKYLKYDYGYHGHIYLSEWKSSNT